MAIILMSLLNSSLQAKQPHSTYYVVHIIGQCMRPTLRLITFFYHSVSMSYLNVNMWRDYTYSEQTKIRHTLFLQSRILRAFKNLTVPDVSVRFSFSLFSSRTIFFLHRNIQHFSLIKLTIRQIRAKLRQNSPLPVIQ